MTTSPSELRTQLMLRALKKDVELGLPAGSTLKQVLAALDRIEAEMHDDDTDDGLD